VAQVAWAVSRLRRLQGEECGGLPLPRCLLGLAVACCYLLLMWREPREGRDGGLSPLFSSKQIIKNDSNNAHSSLPK
jgi:hypothetical protein